MIPQVNKTDSSKIEIRKITKLKRKMMYSLLIGDEEVIVTEDTIVTHHITKGKYLSEEEFAQIRRAVERDKYFMKATNYISYQMRSAWEIKKYLKEYGASIHDIDDITKKMFQLGLINDEVLANSILLSMCTQLKGPNAFYKKLSSRRINSEMKYGQSLEEDIITKAISKLKDKRQDDPKNKQKEYLMNKLMRDGFTISLIYSKMDETVFTDHSEKKIEGDIAKLFRKYEKIEGYEKKKKIIAAMLRKGYDYRSINEQLNNISKNEAF